MISSGILSLMMPNWRAPTHLGTLINQDFTTLGSLSNYTITHPNSTIALSGGYLRMTHQPGTGGFANYIRYDGYGASSLQNWEHEVVVIPRANGATDYGISLGTITANANFSVTWAVFLNLTNSASAGKLQIYSSGVAKGALSSAVSFSLGDRLKLQFNRTGQVYTASVTNLTTSSSTFTTSYTVIVL